MASVSGSYIRLNLPHIRLNLPHSTYWLYSFLLWVLSAKVAATLSRTKQNILMAGSLAIHLQATVSCSLLYTSPSPTNIGFFHC